MTTDAGSHFKVAVFSSPDAAVRGLEGLVAQGFPGDQLTVISSEERHREALAKYAPERPPSGTDAKAAAVGGAVGALLSGAAAAGVLTVAGLPVVAAGAVFFAAGGGAVAGTFAGAMTARGLRSDLADYYDQAVTDGKILVAAHATGDGASERLARAETMLIEAGADPVDLP